MSRVRFECPPCGAAPSVCVLDVTLTPVPVLEATCPVCLSRVRLWVSASVWWEVACARAAVRDELELFAAEVARVRTPADIGGGL